MQELVQLNHELETLRSRAEAIQTRIAAIEGVRPTGLHWAPTGFYTAYHANTGFMLGGIAALSSLLLNVVAAPLAGKSPLELIRVYLTFPLGERALALATGSKDIYAIPDGMILSMGCCLYITTGMLLGVPFHVVLMRFTDGMSLGVRLGFATVLALLLWFVNFYLILNWLQPVLFGGRWITDSSVLPPWVAAVTHVIFGWTMALLAPLGRFVPYQQPHAEGMGSGE